MGTVVAGRYRVLARLGQGGMGVTYRAWDMEVSRPVVLKHPKPEMLASPGFLERFSRETRMMAAFSHPNVAPITTVGEHDGIPYLVMPFLPGGSLSNRRLREESGEPQLMHPSTLHLWLSQVAAALDYVHSQGVVHRDVKPGNVFFDAFWHAYLGDFGISKIVEDTDALDKEHTLTATSVAVGTQGYMAPELFAPKPVLDGRTDQYALAVMVYEILAGRRPFTGDTAHLIVEVTTKNVPPLRGFRRDLPRSLEEAVEQALAKHSGDRFRSCLEFVEHALADVPPMQDDPDVARLLCPACENLLKLPTSAGGKGGRCPRCKNQMEVAADLSAFWLTSEERGAKTSSIAIASSEPSSDSGSGSQSWEALPVGFASGKHLLRTRLLHALTLSPRVRRGIQASLVIAPTIMVMAILFVYWRVSRPEGAAGNISIISESIPAEEPDNSDHPHASDSATPKEAANTEEASLASYESNHVLRNSIGMEFVLVPSGDFMMGSGTGNDDEKPVHRVELSRSFYMGITEVTNAQWTVVCGDPPSKWNDTERPVEMVHWNDVNVFLQQLSALPAEKEANRVYRLPTEAEWEYACRAGSTTGWQLGDDAQQASKYAWHAANSGTSISDLRDFYDRDEKTYRERLLSNGCQTHPVGRKQPNPWGLFDMHGNVREWCSDVYSEYHPAPLTRDPKGVIQEAHGHGRIQRGGSFIDQPCSASKRAHSGSFIKYDFVGFRAVCDATAGDNSTASK